MCQSILVILINLIQKNLFYNIGNYQIVEKVSIILIIVCFYFTENSQCYIYVKFQKI